MKKILSILLILAAFVFSGRAQIIYNVLTTTNPVITMPILSNFQTQSNTVNTYIAQHTLMITNINTNTWYYGSYGYSLWGYGGTNLFLAASFNTNFSAANGWTNGETAYIQVPPVYPQPAVTPWGTIYSSNAPGITTTNGYNWQ